MSSRGTGASRQARLRAREAQGAEEERELLDPVVWGEIAKRLFAKAKPMLLSPDPEVVLEGMQIITPLLKIMVGNTTKSRLEFCKKYPEWYTLFVAMWDVGKMSRAYLEASAVEHGIGGRPRGSTA